MIYNKILNNSYLQKVFGLFNNVFDIFFILKYRFKSYSKINKDITNFVILIFNIFELLIYIITFYILFNKVFYLFSQSLYKNKVDFFLSLEEG